MAEVLIDVQGVRHSYGGKTVLDVSGLRVEEGEALAVLGPNGAGKSTLFRILCLVEKPDAGTLRYFGQQVSGDSLAVRRRMAAVFQRPTLFAGDVLGNVGHGLRFRRVSRPRVEERARRALELMGVGHLAEANVSKLSGGERQRVVLARALVVEPEILLLDEPTSDLDPGARRRLREDLRQAVEELETALVLITHDHNEALALADTITVLREGRIVQNGSAEEVFAQPRDRFVADFMGVETVWHGKVRECRGGLCVVDTSDGLRVELVTEAEVGEDIALAFRPEDVAVWVRDENREAGSGSSLRNRWPAVVETVGRDGPLVRVGLRLESGNTEPLTALVTRPSAEELQVAPGRRVVAGVKATAIHVLQAEAAE